MTKHPTSCVAIKAEIGWTGQSRHDGSFPMPQVELGVVMERHCTLNWLRTYDDQEWDDVSTDT